MKSYKGILGFIRMKYEQFIIREVDRLDLGSIWADPEPEEWTCFMNCEEFCEKMRNGEEMRLGE